MVIKLNINDRLKSCIPSSSEEQLKLLEKQIIEEGCLDPIIIMQGDVIVDGHNRYEICRKHKIDFDVVMKSFDSVDDAVQYSRSIHLGRRNLSEQNYTIVLGQYYNHSKRTHGGDSGPLPEGSTAESIADEVGLSESTVKRAGKLAEAFDSVPTTIQDAIKDSSEPVSNSTINKLASMDSTAQSQVARDLRVGNASTIKEAVKTASKTKLKPEDKSPDAMKEWNKTVDTASREIKKFVKENLPVGPWMTDTKCKMILSQIDSGLATMRSTKCAKECPKCSGKGCSKCNKTGMVPQQIYDVLAR